jgi:hypothetical protein
MSTPPDVEYLISHLSGPLDPPARQLFRHDAETAVAALPVVGEGSLYRALVLCWRRHFVPPPDLHGPNQYRRSKLIDGQPPIGRCDRPEL